MAYLKVEIDLRNAIVSNNQGGNCGALPGAARLAQNGHNLQYPGTGCGGTVASVDPQLDGLFVPHVGSPAYNGGDDAVCLATGVSQTSQTRGRWRHDGDETDARGKSFVAKNLLERATGIEPV